MSMNPPISGSPIGPNPRLTSAPSRPTPASMKVPAYTTLISGADRNTRKPSLTAVAICTGRICCGCGRVTFIRKAHNDSGSILLRRAFSLHDTHQLRERMGKVVGSRGPESSA
ncbi:hypothetical protein ebA6259 [Aromatoleum aromaticum EbN1]|uniref:Uncharacterized protein n=1 Tax=Aromatoleum aromaticum (strain DSM 19018 / LMG 30748 / EbN1) TaxID=76114 RepID=Q5NZ11_AROAE|nr:hypothetical protein ebA6259 [Aromatoleum aromaticum EbN1]